MRYLGLSLLLLLSSHGCGSSSTTAQTGVESIEFGSGGGITGAVTGYNLNEEGQLLKKEKSGLVPYKVIDRKVLNDIFSKAAAIKSYNYNVPDNIYSFVKIKSSEGENYIVWAFGSDKIDGRVVTLYNELMALTRQ